MVLAVRKVILYKQGVGYFEHQSDIQDNAVVELAFNQSQMNDVLKSLTVLDLSGGIIQSISYESMQPLARQLNEIALNIPDDNALTGLLTQIKGAQVAVEIGSRELEGSVVGIEKTIEDEDGIITPLYFLTLLIDGMVLQALDLRQVRQISLLDESLKKDLQHLLELLITTKQKDQKRLTIYTQGEGQRSLFVSYVLEAPVWKTSYRILLDDGKPSMIQGWALIDNTQDIDWNGVELTLVAGLPVSFVHDLYSPRYQQRPLVEVSQETAYAPPLIESGRIVANEAETDVATLELDDFMQPMAAAVAAPTETRSAKKVLTQAQAREQSVPVATRVSEIGDHFQYEIQTPVTVKRQQSALVPILQTEFEGQRVVLFNPEIREKNPMAAILFKNTTGLMLEGGPITVFEQDTYQGEAMLETIKQDEQRLIPYSVELGCVISQDHRSERQDVHQISIVNGVAELQAYQLKRTVYFIDNKTERNQELYLDHRFTPGWQLAEPDVEPEITEHFYRFQLEASARQITRFTVTEKGKERQRIAISKLDRSQLQLWFDSRYIDNPTQQALNELITLKGTIAELEQRIEQAQQSIQTIFQNQERVRQNLTALGTSEDEKTLRERYISELTQDEDKLHQLQEEIDLRKAEKESLEQHLATRIKNFRYKENWAR